MGCGVAKQIRGSEGSRWQQESHPFLGRTWEGDLGIMWYRYVWWILKACFLLSLYIWFFCRFFQEKTRDAKWQAMSAMWQTVDARNHWFTILSCCSWPHKVAELRENRKQSQKDTTQINGWCHCEVTSREQQPNGAGANLCDGYSTYLLWEVTRFYPKNYTRCCRLFSASTFACHVNGVVLDAMWWVIEVSLQALTAHLIPWWSNLTVMISSLCGSVWSSCQTFGQTQLLIVETAMVSFQCKYLHRDTDRIGVGHLRRGTAEGGHGERPAEL